MALRTILSVGDEQFLPLSFELDLIGVFEDSNVLVEVEELPIPHIIVWKPTSADANVTALDYPKVIDDKQPSNTIEERENLPPT